MDVLFNDFIDSEWYIFIVDKTELDVFYVIMKKVSIITSFKRPIYQILNLTNLI